VRATSTPISAGSAVPCLADCLRRQNPEHPLLICKDSQAVCAPPRLIEGGYKGFNLLSFRGSFCALAQSLGPIDLLSAANDAVLGHCENGLCFIGDSSDAVKEQID